MMRMNSRNFPKIILRKIGVAAVVGVAMAGVAAVRAEVRLLDPVYDFGLIKEVDGAREGYARIVNEGSEPTYIRDVRPSCGCTGADYPRGEIAPGDTATVSFTYNPIGRPGNFNKTVKVYLGDSDERLIIRLKGRVLGTPQTLSGNYPIESGRLRLSEKNVDLSNIKEGAGRHTFIRMVNQSMDTIRPVWVNNYKALSIDVTPRELAPGEIATLGIFFNTRFEDKTGDVEYVIPVKAEGDEEIAEVRIVSHIIKEEEASQEEVETP